MFGAICSGRPIQLAEQVEPTKYVISVPNAASISHIAIFLLPDSPFVDPNYTALVYFQLPNSQEFKLLGGINPVKPSAIYKLNNNDVKSIGAQHGQIDDADMSMDDGAANADNSNINIGISIESSSEAEILLAQAKEMISGDSQALVTRQKPPVSPQSVNDIAVLANKIVGQAYNYLGSFVDASGKVSMKAFDTWWDKFKAKLANNPRFLDELKD